VNRSGARQDHYNAIIDKRGAPDGWVESIEKGLDKIPIEHLDYIGSITYKPPASYVRQNSSSWMHRGSGSRNVAGVYMRDDASVHVHPASTIKWYDKRNGNVRVLIHEVGHHADYEGAFGDWEQRQAITHYVHPAVKNLGSSSLAKMGLTSYSFKNDKEFISQAYECWHFGTSSQWDSLVSFVDGNSDGMTSFGTYFGPSRPAGAGPEAMTVRLGG